MRTVLDILIYSCGALVVVGGLCLSYLGVSGSLHNQRMLALWVLYLTLFFVLTGAFLYFYQNLQKSLANEPERERPLLAVESTALRNLADGRGFVEVAVRNAGNVEAHTATVNTTLWGRSTEEDDGRGCPEPKQAPPETMQSVENFGVNTVRLSGSGVILTKEQMLNIAQQKTRLYVYLVSEYGGRSDRRYTLEYYARYDPVTGSFQVCPGHNSANGKPTDTPVRRAWITVQSAGFVCLTIGEPIRVKAVFVNSGETPAYNFVTGGRVEVRFADNPVPNPLPIDQIKFSEGAGIVGGSGNTYQLIGDVGEPLNKETLALIKQGRMKVYMWGMIKYEDVSKNPQSLKFCLENVGTEGFSPCSHSNEGT